MNDEQHFKVWFFDYFTQTWKQVMCNKTSKVSDALNGAEGEVYDLLRTVYSKLEDYPTKIGA